MDDITLKSLWKVQDEKLDRTMKLNLFILDSMQKQKAQSKLKGLARLKLVAVILGILWTLFLGVLVYGNQLQNIYFTVSVGMIMLITIAAIAIYIKHIVLIKELDYSQSITDTQKKLAKLQASTFNNRFILLQTPFYTTFFWSTEMIQASVTKFCLIAVPITLLFTLLTLWVYKNLTPLKMHKKWVSYLLKNDPEQVPVMQAQKFLNEIEEFKKAS
ncbi:MAG: hypothetical protein IPO01_16285 [Chitinophagaceae bacterium]|nr:hypothetical protein [Chitinophagaceae bacterium]MBK8786914.1 hypothetical protein [Chitinophagaceae bacterium]MBK9486675.1 hypothetical protein [Chitinophagaceae bacterium]MBL0202471.1 hypothetical protein [Chitinophagaceae bacterium]